MDNGCWVDAHLGKRKDSGGLPFGNGSLNFWRPHHIRFVRRTSTVRVGSRNVIVRASDLVLGTVPALGKVLVAADVTAFASLTALTGLGVAATRRTTTGTGHGCRRRVFLLLGARVWRSPSTMSVWDFVANVVETEEVTISMATRSRCSYAILETQVGVRRCLAEQRSRDEEALL